MQDSKVSMGPKGFKKSFCRSIGSGLRPCCRHVTEPSFKEQVFKVHEDVIVAVVNRLLSDNGFDLMTVDEVAVEVGIGKASLYKHFASKEPRPFRSCSKARSHAAKLAADAALDDFDRLVSMARWAVRRQIDGEMPALPAQSPTLCEAMGRNAVDMERLVQLSDRLGSARRCRPSSRFTRCLRKAATRSSSS